MKDKLAAAELVQLDIPLAQESHPWKPLVGRFLDHPDLEEVEQHMRDYRRRVEEQGDRL